MTHYDHLGVMDLMDRITDLKTAYRTEWLLEYTPYRLGSALGRWDSEYQYWRRVHRSCGTSMRPPMREIACRRWMK